jgi:hypothetical protein
LMERWRGEAGGKDGSVLENGKGRLEWLKGAG